MITVYIQIQLVILSASQCGVVNEDGNGKKPEITIFESSIHSADHCIT